MSEAGELEGRVAVITGGVSGIGRGIAEAMAGRGATVAILDLDQRQAAEAAATLGGSGSHRGYRADVARSSDIDSAIDAVTAEFGGLDIMVNNAGAPRIGKPTHEISDEDWRETVGALQDGVFFGMRAAGRVMVQQGRGNVINIASIRSFAPSPGRLAYCAAKAAVAMMTKVAALEWGQHGVRVNAIAPGMTRTAMFQRAVAAGHLDEGHFDRVVPLGGVAEPSDIAELACFLASDRARYVTGTLMTVDGGLTLVPIG
jgi:NAD(P)-dependent dehydrogenase (short-subunit alcohol dehydrogenase family)